MKQSKTLKNITFPIRMDVQCGSKTEHKELNVMDMVRCIRCGEPFRVLNATVRKYGDLTCLCCPNGKMVHNTVTEEDEFIPCGYTADVLYYFDRVVKE